MNVHTQVDERALESLFADRIKAALVATALEAIRPAAVAEAERVVAEMAPRIRQHYEMLEDRFIAQFVVRPPQ